MAALFVEKGYGQVEPNRLTAMVDANFESQAPAYNAPEATFEDLVPIPELENGMFLCLVADVSETSPMGRIAVLPGAAPATARPYMVFSERKQYDEREGYSDFVDRAVDKVDGTLYPRLLGMNEDSDVFTTNTISASSGTVFNVGDFLYVGDDGYLAATQGTNTCVMFEVVKVYTLPNGQPAVKLMSRTQV